MIPEVSQLATLRPACGQRHRQGPPGRGQSSAVQAPARAAFVSWLNADRN